MAVLDLRDRCARQRCHKLIRQSNGAQVEFQRYKPYCSYHCQEWDRTESAARHLATLKRTPPLEAVGSSGMTADHAQGDKS